MANRLKLKEFLKFRTDANLLNCAIFMPTISISKKIPQAKVAGKTSQDENLTYSITLAGKNV
jgi:hypothetical protein